jgi:hypothetical protein
MRRLLALVVLVVVGIVGLLVWAAGSTSVIRDTVVAALNERFESKVDLESLEVHLFPTASLSGTGLALRHDGRTDVPPLITVGRFDAGAGFYGLIARPIRLRTVTLDELTIRIPPKHLRGDPTPDDTDDASDPKAELVTSTVAIDELVAKLATLEIASSKPDRLPRVFKIHDLVMNHFERGGPAAFHATVDNPVPRGPVETKGSFGPWNARDPERTPLSGEYDFKHANMNTIKGLGGTLSSTGSYRGVLERIEVQGETRIPDFSLDLAGHQVPLNTRFKAVVDGTNGDTWLERVDARLIESVIVASGAVVRAKDIKGRHVALDVKVQDGRLEDLIRLAVKKGTPVTGRIDVKTKLLLPAGQEDVVERLQLDGEFSLAQARFTSTDVQKRINMLSQRGRGEEDGSGEAASVVSNLGGRFTLKNGLLSFSSLTFAVPGAKVQLAGTYDLRHEEMAFAGDLLLDASLPDTMSGWKSIVARAAQPFFRRPGGGSKLPIKIAGPRNKPAFGLDVRRAFWVG